MQVRPRLLARTAVSAALATVAGMLVPMAAPAAPIGVAAGGYGSAADLRAERIEEAMGRRFVVPQRIILPKVVPGDVASLNAALDTALGKARRNVALEVRSRTGGQVVFTYHGDLVNCTGSIVKVLVLAATIRKARAAGHGLTASQKALATRMIRVSDNDATTTLFRAVGGSSAITATARAIGMKSTIGAASWGRTTTTVGDQRRLMDALVIGSRALGAGDRAYILSLMQTVTSSQRWGVGRVPAGNVVQLKNGWVPLTPYQWRVNSIGHVSGHGRDYDIAILSYKNPTMDVGVARVNAASALVYASLATPWTK